MKFWGLLIAVCALFMTPVIAQDLPVLRLAVFKSDTVIWELATITENGLDRKYGFQLDVLPFEDEDETRVAVESGDADVAVADWIWVARQRVEGRDYVFIPYSRSVGGLLVPAESPAVTLPDLAGSRIGIAGGPLDKNWLILRAFAQQEYGMDLKAETEQVYGAPPLIYQTALAAELEGAINYWHFLAKMKASGMRELISIETAGASLGMNGDLPMLGYYLKESLLQERPDLAQAFYNASRDAKDILANSGAAWDALRPLMNAQTEKEFETLKTDWQAGIPERRPMDVAAANQMLALMFDLGGEELVGEATSVPDGLFLTLD